MLRARRRGTVMMRGRVGLGLWVLCALWLQPSCARADPVAIDVGGVTIRMSLPPGWCVYPDATFKLILERYETIDRSVVPHVFYGDCAQVEANTRDQQRIRDFGNLGSPRDYLGRTVHEPGTLLDKIAAALQSQDTGAAMSSMRDRLNQAELGIEVGKIRPLGLVGRDENAVYGGFLTSAKMATEKFRQLGILGITVVKGRLLFSYVYADYENEDTLTALLARAQARVAQLRSDNP